MKLDNLINYTKQEFSKAKFLESWFFVKSEFKEIIFYPKFKKHFIFLYLIYLVGYAALLRANIDYLDDIWRSFEGYTKWDNYSRYISEYSSHILHMGWNLLDQSPINQLIAIGLLSLSSIFITNIFFKKEEITYLHLFASIPIGLSPFFLSNIAFKFDSPYMALAVLASIFPFLFVKNNLAFYVIGFLSLLIVLTSYQAAHQIFIVLAIFFILKTYLEDKPKQEIKKLSYNFIAVFFITILFFQIFLNHSYESKTDRLSTLLFFPHEIPIGIYDNLKRYFLVSIYQSFKGTFFLYLLLTSLGLIILNITIKYKKFKKSLFSVLFLILAAISSLGLFILMQNTGLIFRLRNLNGFAMFLVGVLFLILLNNQPSTYIINKVLITLFCYNLIVIANVFANATKIQNDYNNYRAVQVINTLNNDIDKYKSNLISDGRGRILIRFSKDGMIAPQLHNNIQHLPLLSSLIRDNFN